MLNTEARFMVNAISIESHITSLYLGARNFQIKAHKDGIYCANDRPVCSGKGNHISNPLCRCLRLQTRSIDHTV